MMALRLVTPPSREPVDLATAKAYLRVDGSADDTLIAGLIAASRSRYDGRDGILGRALITQTWDLSLDAFPSSCSAGGWIDLPLGPVRSVASVAYADSGGNAVTLDTASYVSNLPGDPAKLYPAISGIWPTPATVPGAVIVRFVAGYGDDPSDVPPGIVQAILLNVAFWYEGRAAAGREFPGDGLALGSRLSWAM